MARDDNPPTCELRVYASLNDFLSPGTRQTTLCRPVGGRPTVKDVIEAAGVPHPEIAFVTVDRTPVGPEHRVDAGARVAAYPETGDLPPPAGPRWQPPGRVDERYLLDVHLGRLARYLRLVGVDARTERDADDAALAEISSVEDRTLLTRDVELLKRSIVRRGRWVRSTDPRRQVVEVLRWRPPGPGAVPFSRCLECNGVLSPVSRQPVLDRLPRSSRAVFHDFTECGSCGKLYWRGGHHERLTRLAEDILSEIGGVAGSP